MSAEARAAVALVTVIVALALLCLLPPVQGSLMAALLLAVHAWAFPPDEPWTPA